MSLLSTTKRRWPHIALVQTDYLSLEFLPIDVKWREGKWKIPIFKILPTSSCCKVILVSCCMHCSAAKRRCGAATFRSLPKHNLKFSSLQIHMVLTMNWVIDFSYYSYKACARRQGPLFEVNQIGLACLRSSLIQCTASYVYQQYQLHTLHKTIRHKSCMAIFRSLVSAHYALAGAVLYLSDVRYKKLNDTFRAGLIGLIIIGKVWHVLIISMVTFI